MPLIDLNGLGHFKAKENAMVADVYSASKTYAVGDYVYYNGTLYRCTTAIATAEAWTAGHWTAVKLADDCSALMNALNGNNINESLTLSLTANEWVKATGTFEVANGWSRTDKIDTGGAVSVTVDKAVNIALYKSNGDFLNVRTTLTANSPYSLNENVGKIVLYAASGTINSATAYYTKTSPIAKIANIENAISTMKTETTINPTSVVSNCFIMASGSVSESSGWVCTSYIKLPFDDISSIKIKGTFNGYAGCAIYDENKQTILGIDGNNVSDYGGTGQNALQEITVPHQTGMRYIRITAYSSVYSALTDLYVKGYTISGAFVRISNAEEKIKSIESNVSTTISESKTLVIGDSISADAYGNYTKWVTVLVNQGFLPADTTNSSQPATGFVSRYNNEANDFISRVTAIENKSSYDLVIVFGGINDYNQNVPLGGGEGETSITTYFKPAVDYFFDYLVENFTQARICVLLPLRTYATWTNSVDEYQTAYSDYINTVAKSYCLPVLNLTEDSGFCPFNSTFSDMWTLEVEGVHDGVHPNADYEEKYLAPMIKGFLQGLM